MPLPIFPTESGSPGDGDLVAIHAAGSTQVVGGLIQFAQAVEGYPGLGIVLPIGLGNEGEPLNAAGVTIWLRASLLLSIHGEPTVTDYADMLNRWNMVRNKLLSTNYELFLYYRTAAPATYRKYKSVTTALLRSYWNNPASLTFTLAAVSTDKTLYTTAPGL